MLDLVSVVEGHGEVKALPILLRRVLGELNAINEFRVLTPIRQPRDRLLKPGELEKAVELAARTISRKGGILVVLDSEGAAPCLLGPQLLGRAHAAARDIPTRLVLAHREWEAWYLAAIVSLAGRRGLRDNLEPPPDPEAIKGAKEWLAQRMRTQSYSPALDQPAFAGLFSLDAAQRSPSFSKLYRDVRSLLDEALQKFPI